MYFYFIDDSKLSPHDRSRERAGNLVAVGGIIVSAEKVGPLEQELEAVCTQKKYSVPNAENIKWSPPKGSWLREHLDGEIRQELFAEMLKTVRQADAKVVVAITDSNCKQANATASNHEIDATLLALERFNTWLAPNFGTVVVSKPSGGAKDEKKFVSECVEHLIAGTAYVDFGRLALKPMIMPANHARLLQVADLVVSITNAHVSGGNHFAARHFPEILSMMPETSKGMKGGLGLKLHPSFRYRNLYHWLLSDEYFVEGSTGTALPDSEMPYPRNPREWR